MLGTQNNTGIDAATNLAIMYYDWGKPEKGEPLLRKVLQDIYTKFANYCKYLNVDEIEQSRATLVLYTNKYQELNVAANYTAKQDNALLYNIELHFKGLVLQNATALKTSVLSNNDTDLMQKYNIWVEYNRELDRMQGSKKEKKQVIAALKTKERNAYRELFDRSEVFKKLADFWATDVQRIQNGLSTTSASIEFIYYKKTTNDAATLQTDTTTYYAAILVLKTGTPTYIQLGTATEINALLLRKHDAANEATEINAIYTQKQDALYQQVWQPIQAILQNKNVTDIYYAPSGVLHNLSFDALVANKTKGNLHRVSSTRQLLQRNNAAQTPTSIVAFGDIEYEADDNELDKLSPKLAQKNATNTFFAPLSATDIDSLKAIANKKGIRYTAYTGLAANEAQFKLLGTTAKSASPTILHISTHGFYLPRDAADTSNTGKAFLAISPDPLARSGLALAGANRFWRNAADTVTAENGILLANEIAQSNLQQTDLVVLSACETALGDVNGEGVFGLQRGFKQAGAQSILMSLWRIDDAASAEMLIAFYSFYLVENQTKQQAFDAAQTKMRAKYPNNPYIWASFVLLD